MEEKAWNLICDNILCFLFDVKLHFLGHNSNGKVKFASHCREIWGMRN